MTFISSARIACREIFYTLNLAILHFVDDLTCVTNRVIIIIIIIIFHNGAGRSRLSKQIGLTPPRKRVQFSDRLLSRSAYDRLFHTVGPWKAA